MLPTPKIAVIGAGVSGLLAIKYSKQLSLDVTCFEQTNDTCGVWCYSETAGLDKNGIKVHSAMYKNLRTNVANQLMGFEDFELDSSKVGLDVSSCETKNFLPEFLHNWDGNV